VSLVGHITEHTSSLVGKTVAVTGSTGGLGKALCWYLASLGASLILVDRNRERSEAHRDKLKEAFEGLSVQCVIVDLEDMVAVKTATDLLVTMSPDVFIHNAGAYSIPRHTCDTGYDNVFQINFVSPYYMIRRLLPALASKNGHVVAVGSIAHNYSKSDPASVDFADRKAASKVYGNAKRYLMYGLMGLFRGRTDVTLSLTHPGISLTGITDHYPKPVFAVIKHPMKVLFMRPKKACLSTLYGVFEPCRNGEWIGPRWFNVWGYPKHKRLKTASAEEQQHIFECAEAVYRRVR